MSEDKNEDASITEYDKDNLELVFSAANNIKNEMSKSLTDNSETILKTLNILLLLAGIYFTLLIFINNPLQSGSPPVLWPEILSGIFLLIAIFRTIIELFPVPSVPVIYPRAIYALISGKREESLELIIPTYLSATNELWIRSEEKNFSRQQIILFISIYLVNFVLFSIYCIFRNYEIYLNILSIVFSIGFIIFFLWFIKDRRAKLNKLPDILDNKK